jgi:glutathione S-transferase
MRLVEIWALAASGRGLTSMAKIILHQWEISPFCGKVRKILALKKLRYETVDYAGVRALLVKKLSFVGKLPVLEYDGVRIQDSTDIARFLEQRHPEPALYPADPVERAEALLFEDWADESFYWYEVFLRSEFPDVFEKTLELFCKERPRWEWGTFGFFLHRIVRKQMREQGLGRQSRETVISNYFELLASLDAILLQREWLAGPALSIADIAVSAQLDEMVRTSHLAPRILEHKGIAAWLARCTTR